MQLIHGSPPQLIPEYFIAEIRGLHPCDSGAYRLVFPTIIKFNPLFSAVLYSTRFDCTQKFAMQLLTNSTVTVPNPIAPTLQLNILGENSVAGEVIHKPLSCALVPQFGELNFAADLHILNPENLRGSGNEHANRLESF